MDYKKKIIACCLLAMAIMSATSVQTARAGSDYGASTWAIYFKKVVVKAAAQAAFRALSNQIINKIKTGGPDGKAAFVQNWVNFTTQAQYRGEAIFRGELSNAKLCDYFSNSLKAKFGVKPTDSVNLAGQNIRTGDLESYGLKNNCTLPNGFDINKYQKDFSKNGGWQAFSRILEPQNNYYGTLFASLGEVVKQRGLSESSAINNAIAGKGFTGLLSGPGGCTLRGTGNKCLIEGNIKTPGSTLEGAAADSTSKGTTALLAAADEASIAVTALTTWAINKLFDLGGGPSTPETASEDVSITSEERTAESYKQEFCTASDNISNEAIAYIQNKHPQAFIDFPPGISYGPAGLLPGFDNKTGSYCQSFYDTDNSYPYSRCSQACLKAVGETPSLAPPSVPPPSQNTGGGFVTCDNPPNTTSPNPMTVMQQVKNEFPNINLVNEGPGAGTRDEFTAIVAWRLHQADANWGRKRAAGPQSTDTLGYLRPDIGPDRFEAVDLIIGTATSATLNRGCYGVVPSDQTWIEPSPAP